MWRVSRPHAPAATQYWTTYNYDALGRTVSVVAADGASTTTYTYAGNTVTTTDPAGKWKKFEMDAVGNLTKVTEPNPAGGTWDTNYTYNLRGQLLTVSMPRNVTQTRSFTYDAEGRTLTATNPETGVTTYTYNGDSTLKDKVDAKYQKAAYFYDAYKRVIEIKRYPKDPNLNQPSANEDACQNTKFYYDGNPFATYGSNLVGRAAVVEYKICAPNKNGVAIERTVREMYSYSQPGQMTGRRFRLIRPFEGNLNWSPSADADFTMAYDAVAGLKQLVQPDFKTWDASNHNIYTSPGYTLDYTFDSMYRMTGLTRKQGTGAAANIVTGMTYGPAGEMLAMQHWQNGSTAGQLETRQYNVLGQLTNIQATAVGGTAVNLVYEYFPTGSPNLNNGRVTKRKNRVSGEEVTYTYDTLQRLTQATATGPSPWSESYSFDGFGNLTGKAGSNWTVDGLTNRIVAPPGIPLSYDANGNQMNNTSSYDIENRLLTWDGTEQYRYGVDNKRVFRRYTDAQNLVQEVYSLYGPNGKVSVELMAVYDPAPSALPTPGMVLNPVQTYQSVGLRRVGWGEPMADRLDTKPAGGGRPYGENVSHFAGHDKDPSGLHYADQRYYSSAWGRFLTADPYVASGGTGDPVSFNLYAYVQGDPENRVDPKGLYQVDPYLDCLNRTWGDIHYCESQNPSSPNSGNGGDTCSHPTSPCNSLPGGGGPIATTVDTGISNALQGINGIATGAFRSKQKCRESFDALARMTDQTLGNTGESLMDQVVGLARSAAAGRTVYDGASSSTPLNEVDFPGTASPGIATVGAWFRADSNRLGLSQINGTAIFINTSFFSSAHDGLGKYGSGILIHELLHKQGAAGGFRHFEIDNALTAIGADPVPGQGEKRGSAIGQICF